MIECLKKIFYLLLTSSCFLFGFNCYSQDIHFSQYFSSPLFLNPALTGQFNGNFRFACNYKSQWVAVANNSFKTFANSIDASIYKDKLFMGLSFFNDKAGDSKMGLTEVNLSIATRVPLNKNNSLTAAIQNGGAQRSIDFSNLTWDNQYDGNTFNKSLPSGEKHNISNFNYFDLSAGLCLISKINDNVNFNSGIAGFHLNNPKQCFIYSDNKLHSKLTIHSYMEFKQKKSNTTLIPSIIILKQGTAYETDLGFMIKYKLGMDSKYTGVNVSSNLTLGGFYRINDAAILYARLIYKNNYSIGLSYDINVSPLNTVSNAKGGGEISIIYIFEKKNNSVKTISCL
ncbi:MAG: PorP/SprF family type IX secretion system membrane protein [Bacteroidales bacterium]|jgi:type IX secretion system PorP/SprF family membrane protein